MLHSNQNASNNFPGKNEIADRYIKSLIKDYTVHQELLEPMLLDMIARDWNKESKLLSEFEDFIINHLLDDPVLSVHFGRSKLLEVVNLQQTLKTVLLTMTMVAIDYGWTRARH